MRIARPTIALPLAGAFAALGALLAGLLVILLALPEAAHAHALVAREDLPLPDWLFAWGASVVLIVSFVALSTLWREARLEGDGWRPIAPRLSAVLLSAPVRVLLGALSIFLLLLVIYAGFAGTEAPDRNFSVVFIFATFWVGLVIVSALLGDVFRALNPWRAIAVGLRSVVTLIGGRRPTAPFTYPERLGRWPAVFGIVLFGWFELVYAHTGFQAVGLTPHAVALATVIYSTWALGGMALFGIEPWLRRGETFSVYMNMFSRLAILDVREGRLGRRRFLSGMSDWGGVPGSVGLVLVTIAVTTYDGAQEGALIDPINTVFEWMSDLGAGPVTALRLTETGFYLATIGAIAGFFSIGVRGMRSIHGAPGFETLARGFAHSLIPIGLAYIVAHYFSLLVFLEQAQFGYLLSDPLGDGSDIFGTADRGIDYTVIGGEAIWYIQVGSLVAGHVAALVLAHDRALVVYDSVVDATRSQYWMLAVMVGFTTLGLFLLSQV